MQETDDVFKITFSISENYISDKEEFKRGLHFGMFLDRLSSELL